MQRLLQYSITVAILTGTCAAADEVFTKDDVKLNAILADLDSADFDTRQSAQEQLRQLTAGQLIFLAEHAKTSRSAESAVRCVQALEHHFMNDDSSQAIAAFEALYALVNCERAVVREQVAWVLSHRWEKRIQLATDQLKQYGALIVLPDAAVAAQKMHRQRQADPQGLRQRGLVVRARSSDQALQVFLTDEWHGDEEALRLLQRLPERQFQDGQAFGANGERGGRLIGGRNGPPSVSVFLVSGHPLNEDAEAWVKRVPGNSIQERGSVMLGITSYGGIVGDGCVIRAIVPFGSGDAAGLQSADKITAVEKQSIAGFDELVHELRQFTAGEMVEITFERSSSIAGQPLVSESINVRLRSWKDYVKSTNQAAAEYKAAMRLPK